MSMTREKMRQAGEHMNRCTFTDSELKNCLKGVQHAVSFFEGAGHEWSLALKPLWSAERQLKGFLDARKCDYMTDKRLQETIKRFS